MIKRKQLERESMPENEKIRKIEVLERALKKKIKTIKDLREKIKIILVALEN